MILSMVLLLSELVLNIMVSGLFLNGVDVNMLICLK